MEWDRQGDLLDWSDEERRASSNACGKGSGEAKKDLTFRTANRADGLHIVMSQHETALACSIRT